MDHKKFFETYGELGINVSALGIRPYSAEQIYQAIKARLVEELCTETVKNEFGQHSFLRLIDTTEQS